MEGDATQIEQLVKASGWFFSKIDNDPLLGTGTKCYATKHFPITMHLDNIILTTKLVASKYASFDGCKVIRRKIEKIVYDTKTGLNCQQENI